MERKRPPFSPLTSPWVGIAYALAATAFFIGAVRWYDPPLPEDAVLLLKSFAAIHLIFAGILLHDLAHTPKRRKVFSEDVD